MNNTNRLHGNLSTAPQSMFAMNEYDEYRNPMDLLATKIIIILLYVVVFLTCFIGNSLVILVIAVHYRMRTATNFFLANLAVSDLGVAIFCVLPNMSTYLSPHWVLGRAMCKLYYFVQTTCYTASVATLIAIALERYVAIIHPMRNRRLHGTSLLVVVVVVIWTMAVVSSLHYLIIFDTQQVPAAGGGGTVQFCLVMSHFNARLYVAISFVLWYAGPLVTMAIVYARISTVLWKSSAISRTSGTVNNTDHSPAMPLKTSTDDDVQAVIATGRTLQRGRLRCIETRCFTATRTDAAVAAGRRRVIRLLVAVVVSFAVCVLPYNVRVIWQTFSEPRLVSDWQLIIPPLTFLVYYLNSAVNPLLYAFLSGKFRSSLYDVLRGRCSQRRYEPGNDRRHVRRQ